jgi:rubrerythrin
MKWRCGVCGFVHEGGAAPDQCPNCRAAKEKFDALKEGQGLLQIVDYNKLGVANGSGYEEDLKLQFQGECAEVGMYIAMARQAEREGYPEVAETMKRIAWEEAHHAARFCELIGGISECTKTNLERLVAGESGANTGKKGIAVRSKADNQDAIHDAVHEACKDEARHAAAFNGLLTRLFGGS